MSACEWLRALFLHASGAGPVTGHRALARSPARPRPLALTRTHAERSCIHRSVSTVIVIAAAPPAQPDFHRARRDSPSSRARRSRATVGLGSSFLSSSIHPSPSIPIHPHPSPSIHPILIPIHIHPHLALTRSTPAAISTHSPQTHQMCSTSTKLFSLQNHHRHQRRAPEEEELPDIPVAALIASPYILVPQSSTSFLPLTFANLPPLPVGGQF